MTDADTPRFAQSAVIPYRWRDGILEVLLVTSSRRRRWVVPKGLLEPGMSPAESAANEAREEAGVVGETPWGPIGHYAYEKWGGVCEVEVFAFAPTTVLDAWEEDFRDRAWCGIEEAATRLREPDLQAIVRRLPEALAAREE